MELLKELDFSLELPTDGVIESRTEVVIDSPATSHTASTNNIVRLYINGSGFIDPHSVQIYADVSCPNLQDKDNVIPPATYELFETIRVIDGRGNVLEEINQAGLLSQKLHEASSNTSFLDCTYGFTNSQKDVSKRIVDTATNFRLSALDVLGFFNQSKYLHLPTFKGLQIELRCVTNDVAFSIKHGTTDNVTYSLENVKLHYTEVQASRGYMEQYAAKLLEGGYAINFSTYAHLQNNSGGTGQTQIALNKTASKVKAVFSTVREGANRGNKLKREVATDSRVVSYQYQIDGRNYPSQPVSSAAKAYHELLEANYNHKDNRHSNICYEDFTGQWAFAGGKADADVKKGSYAMWYDLEKASSSPLSGTPMKANSAFLKVNIDAAVTSPVVDTFVNFERVLSVQEDRIIIVD